MEQRDEGIQDDSKVSVGWINGWILYIASNTILLTVDQLLWARLCARSFIYINSPNSHNSPVG